MIVEKAHAKINLYLHVTGRRPDGYHLLDSLFVFADAGDVVGLEAAETPLFSVTGPYGDSLSGEKNNSVLKAARLMCEALNEKQAFKLTLEKNLPVASGMGGGSADAAAAMRLIMRFFEKKPSEKTLNDIALAVGADVPACLWEKPVFVSGIGEKMTFAPAVPDFPVLLVNPNVAVPTPAVFKNRTGDFDAEDPMTADDFSPENFIGALKRRHNGLTAAAVAVCPQISDVLNALANAKGCLFSAMSGSGATCVALFDDVKTRDACFDGLSETYPKWWGQKASFI